MRRRLGWLRLAGSSALLVALVACVAACAGDADEGEAKSAVKRGFTASATFECVKSREPVRDVDTTVTLPSLDAATSDETFDFASLVSEASGGRLMLKLDSGNVVAISFHGSVADAEADLLTHQLVAREFGTELAQRKANAVLEWLNSPSRVEADLVKECLSKGGGPIPVHEQDPSTATSYRYSDKQRAAFTSAARDRGYEQSAVACFMKWAQQRYSIVALLSLPADEDPVRAALEHCARR